MRQKVIEYIVGDILKNSGRRVIKYAVKRTPSGYGYNMQLFVLYRDYGLRAYGMYCYQSKGKHDDSVIMSSQISKLLYYAKHDRVRPLYLSYNYDTGRYYLFDKDVLQDDIVQQDYIKRYYGDTKCVNIPHKYAIMSGDIPDSQKQRKRKERADKGKKKGKRNKIEDRISITDW